MKVGSIPPKERNKEVNPMAALDYYLRKFPADSAGRGNANRA